jgi:hypothetical protein
VQNPTSPSHNLWHISNFTSFDPNRPLDQQLLPKTMDFSQITGGVRLKPTETRDLSAPQISKGQFE